MTFSKDITKFVKTTENRLRATVIEASAKFAEKVIKQTPIDLPFGWHDPESVGYARGGWFITFDGNSSRLTGRLDPTGEATLAAVRSGLNNYRIRSHSSIHLNNNVPYINILEFGGYDSFVNRLKSTTEGYSTQAPAGMVRLNIFLWPIIVARVTATTRMLK